MKEEIKKWFAGDKDYLQGIELLELSTANKILITNLRRKKTAAHQSKLEHELKKCLQQDHMKKRSSIVRMAKPKRLLPPVKKTESKKDEKEMKLPEEREKNYPADLQDMMIELRKLHNERGKLSNSLRDFAVNDNAGRKSVLDRMDEINERMKEIKQVRNEFEQSGTMPSAEQEKKIPNNTFALLQQLQNMKSNRSKWTTKKNKAQPGSGAYIKAENKLSKLQTEIDEIEGIVNIRKSQAEQA